jgi:hypothetical protein
MCETLVGRLESVEDFVLCCWGGSCSRGTILVASLKRERVRRGRKTSREVRCEKNPTVLEERLGGKQVMRRIQERWRQGVEGSKLGKECKSVAGSEKI